VIPIAVTVQSNLLTKRGHAKLMRDLLRETLEEHRDQKLPKHFERNADTAPGGGYGYSARTAKYQRRKAKQAGHQIPLVLTGRLKQAIMSGVKITATQHRSQLKTRGYFPMRVAMRMEIESITEYEQSEMRGMIGLKYSHYAKTKPEYQEFRRQRMRA
jgi:hypothetical protein